MVSLDSECPAIHWRGDSRFAADIAALIDKWARVGTPGLSDYQIDVATDPDDMRPDQWVIQTANATLRFVLPGHESEHHGN